MARLSAAGERRRGRGFAMMMALLAVALLALATTLPLRVEAQRQQREREIELLFAGRAIRAAIASYHADTPGAVKQYPASFDDLLLDRRFPAPRRHLRRLYRDPFTGAADWTLIREQGLLVGVASRSAHAPVLRSGFGADEPGFADAMRVADWQFIHRAAAAAVAPPVAAPAPAPDPAAPPAAAPPPAASPGRRAECLRLFSLATQACLASPAPDCRTRAREQWKACMS